MSKWLCARVRSNTRLNLRFTPPPKVGQNCFCLELRPVMKPLTQLLVGFREFIIHLMMESFVTDCHIHPFTPPGAPGAHWERFGVLSKDASTCGRSQSQLGREPTTSRERSEQEMNE